MDLLSDNVASVTLAPDKEAERQFLPAAHTLAPRSLSLRDRGYIDVKYFEQLEDVGAFLICRAREDLNPTIVQVTAGLPTKLRKKWTGKRLQQLRKSKLRSDLDLVVGWSRPGGRVFKLRLVIRYIRENKRWTWLLTNLARNI